MQIKYKDIGNNRLSNGREEEKIVFIKPETITFEGIELHEIGTLKTLRKMKSLENGLVISLDKSYYFDKVD